MEDLIEALKERVSEVREQIIYNRILEKNIRQLTREMEDKIAGMNIRMDAQRRASELANKSLEDSQKKYIDLQSGSFEKKVKAFEESQAAKSEALKSAFSRISCGIKSLNEKLDREKTKTYQRTDELERKIISLERAHAQLKKNLMRTEKELSKAKSKIRFIKPHGTHNHGSHKKQHKK